MPAVRRFTSEDAPAAALIIEGLPDYFTKNVPEKVQRDAERQDAWVLTDSGAIAGIAVAARKSAGAAEILWSGSPSMPAVTAWVTCSVAGGLPLARGLPSRSQSSRPSHGHSRPSRSGPPR